MSLLDKIKTNIKRESVLITLLKAFLFLSPWQTIWIYREVFVDGVKMEYATLGFYATEILLWVAVCVFIVWYWKKWNMEHKTLNTRFRLTKDRVFVFACLSLISYLLISITWSIDKVLALQQSLRVMEAFLLFFIFMLGPLKFNEAVKWLALGAVLPSLLGIWQFFSQSTFAFKWLGLAEHIASNPGASVVVGDEIGRWLRAYGPFSHPNVFGGYSVIIFSLVLMRLKDSAFVRPGRTTADKFQIERLKDYLFFISYLLSLISVFLSFSRSALLALVIVILLNCYMVIQQKKFVYLLSFISYLILPTVILTIILFPALKVRVLTSSPHEVASVVERAQGFNESWDIFKNNLWLGVGAGNYTAYLQKIDPTRQQWEYQPAHNVGFLFLAESGVVGLALILFVILSFIIYHLSGSKDRKTERLRDFLSPIFYLLSFISYLVLAFFDHYLISSYAGLILTGIFFGLVFRSEYAPKGSPLGKVVPNSSTVD